MFRTAVQNVMVQLLGQPLTFSLLIKEHIIFEINCFVYKMLGNTKTNFPKPNAAYKN